MPFPVPGFTAAVEPVPVPHHGDSLLYRRHGKASAGSAAGGLSRALLSTAKIRRFGRNRLRFST